MTTGEEIYQVRGREERFRGPVFTVVTDQVTMPDGRVVARDYLRHVGAVAVAAVDDDGRVALVRQYRHPVGRPLWELPAGLVDVPGEELPAAALRELAEEADLTAERIELLVDLHTSPGCSDELIRIYLARGLAPVAELDRHERRNEEAGMQLGWFNLDDAVEMVFNGMITNAACVAGVLAAARSRAAGWASLRPASAPLPR
ncbi:ADP-ribose pyrophosphatase [Micromonospora pattaloongensis]|uniref:ADP-ribose pyrophosphatase n=1 Tax=Micromonospora pattaloongensis TaxID=405436 RepID=A0A1H3T0X1_9ACTN|nr:NUDIX hydrolase [Micromonospora pattaloongensis]SDZ43824.1 ADP-ribose pyrophosphatase [Micromonospora pattaloongensis]